jgi:hypothetical protein
VASDDGVDSKSATVTLTVLAPNQPPKAKDDQATTAENAPVRINVLANDTDPDGTPLQTLTR